jgi:hypothetical protein
MIFERQLEQQVAVNSRSLAAAKDWFRQRSTDFRRDILAGCGRERSLKNGHSNSSRAENG